MYERLANDNAARERRYEVSQGREARARALRSARVRVSPGRRYLSTVTSNDASVVIDSAKSRVYRAQRRIKAWSEAMPDRIRVVKRGKEVWEEPRLVMITLTYRDALGWAPNDIREYMLRLRGEHKSRLLAYAWIMETQARGAPHYHVMLYLKRGTLIEKPDTSGAWSHGMSKIETARSPFYILRYAGKEYQKEMLPSGARMFAVWVSESITEPEKYLLFRISSLPGWFRDEIAALREAGVGVSVGGWRRASGGGWLLESTGEVYTSPWSLVGVERIDGRVLDWGSG